MSSVRTACISGHTDLSDEEFNEHYAPRIEEAVGNGHHLIFGDASGVDTQALAFLLSPSMIDKNPNIRKQFTIYCTREYNISALKRQGVQNIVHPKDPSMSPNHETESLMLGIKKSGRDKARYRHIIRDAHMTLRSDYDILYVRSEEESRAFYGNKYRDRLSATEMNRRRRAIVNARREGKDEPTFEVPARSAWDEGYEGVGQEESAEMLGELPAL